MFLAPPHNPPIPERILTFGTMGSGKSQGMAKIACYMPPGIHVHVLDNDGSWPRILAGDEFRHLTNVTVHQLDATDFQSHVDIVQSLRPQLSPKDWLVCDLITPTWEAVQSWYTDTVFHQSIDEYFLAVRAQMKTTKQGGDDKTLGAFEGFTDWPIVNKVYQRRWMRPLTSVPCHVYCIAEADKVSEGGRGMTGDSKDTKALFGPYGAKPKGQKVTGHRFATVLLMKKERVGGWTMTTVKDIGRATVENLPVTNFAVDYLLKIAKWKPTVG